MADTLRKSVVLAALCAIAGAGPALAEAYTPLIKAQTETPEALLLDVGIQVFDPGLPDEDEDALEDRGVFADVRQSEARYIPFHLRETLGKTGLWGVVNVVPAGVESADVTVSGEIIKSTGMDLVVRVKVVDATGRVWKDRKYKDDADPRAYKDDEDDGRDFSDPYRALFNRIANDMFVDLQELENEEIAEIREVARLRFAADLAPVAFDGYLREKKKGRYVLVRLPAGDDPMLARVSKVRERDWMFVDTLNEYYQDFYMRMEEPYGSWRAYSYEEQKNLQEIRKKARKQMILGGLLILGGVAAGGESTAAEVASDAAIIGGAVVLKKGIDTQGEAKMHREALKELAASFDAEMAPLLVEVEGQTLRLQGSAETQYAEWRRLLSDIFHTETGLAVAPDDAPVSSGPVAGGN